jgi:hypothetical protein
VSGQGNLAGPVELRCQHGDQQFLARRGRPFAGTQVEFNPRHLVQQPNHTPRPTVWIGHPIGCQAPAQILGLAHVEDSLTVAAQQVDPWAAGQLPEEFFAQLLDQWLRGRE